MADDPVIIDIEDTLDLHHFNPKDIPDLLNEYITMCIEKDIYEVRIIHGKGKGILKNRVHSILEKHKNVVSFKGTVSGNWGATIVNLEKQG